MGGTLRPSPRRYLSGAIGSMPAVLRHMGTAPPPNIYGANEPHGRVLAHGAGHLSRLARQQKKKKKRGCALLGFIVFKRVILLSVFKLNF